MRSQARDLPRLRAGVLASGQDSPTVRRRPIEACSRERARLADPKGRLGQQSQQESVPQPAAGADHHGHLPGIERDRDPPAGAELRHTRATQAINRGMRLDAIARPSSTPGSPTGSPPTNTPLSPRRSTPSAARPRAARRLRDRRLRTALLACSLPLPDAGMLSGQLTVRPGAVLPRPRR